jgi:hypothetical protein
LSGFSFLLRQWCIFQNQWFNSKIFKTMDKFMLLFHGTAQSEDQFQELSPEAMQAELQKWNTWIGGIAAQGKLIGSEALMPAGKQIKGTKKIVTDGPYSEAKEIVGGYLLLQGTTFEEAVELGKGCPILETDGTVEVRPIQIFG